jgi:HD-GYP domain-containing protein (c-di-GMP phosphodiesterase class II)
MGMQKDDANFIDVQHLRIGLFVELDIGWMAHPFPSGSFKISSAKQIETIRSLGLTRVRHIPEKSDPAPVDEAVVAAGVITSVQEAVAQERAQAAQREQLLRKQRADLLSAQQHSLEVCERRFGEAARQYRKALELVRAQPVLVVGQCQTLVQGFVDDMLADGESSIRLLTETAGDKSAMHPVNVTIVSLLLGKAMGLEPHDLLDLGMAAFLHDMGKIELPDRVRWPEENFSTAEFKLYQEHVTQSVQIGKSMGLSKGALLAIAQHHELVDGSGFPLRIAGEQMAVGSRILALVNRYDNLCNPSRPGAALTPHEALALIFAQLKTRFDAAALSGFIRMMGVYPPGSVVQLVDERYASVVSVNSARPLKPRIIVHEPGVPKHEALIVDLEHAPNISIRRSLKPSSLPVAAMDYLAPRQRISYFFERVVEPVAPEAAA